MAVTEVKSIYRPFLFCLHVFLCLLLFITLTIVAVCVFLLGSESNIAQPLRILSLHLLLLLLRFSSFFVTWRFE